MIHFFTGKPGNGKSLHMAEIIYREMKKGKNVIANFPVNEGYFKNCRHPEKTGVFLYEPNFYWLNNAYILPGGTSKSCSYSYIDGLYNYARMFHKRNKKGQIMEKQTLLVLDECQELFNNRLWNRKDRLLWTGFFRQHRKLGYEVYLISQDDKVIDKQIRNVLQFEYEHRALKYYKAFGKLLSILAGGNLFVVIQKNYSVKVKDAKTKSSFFKGKKKFYDFYDSYAIFDGESQGGAQAPDSLT